MLLLAAALAVQPVPAARPVPAPQPVPAASPESADTRCLVALAAIGAKATPQQQQVARFGTLYFYGRIMGRNPRIALGAAMRAATVAVQPRFQAELQRCAAEFQKAGATLQAAGAALQAK